MAAKKPVQKTTAALKKSGIDKLTKIGKTTSEAHISYAVRHGKITKYEAAAIDPKNFKTLLDNSKSKVIATMDSKTGKVTKVNGGGGMGTGRGGLKFNPNRMG
jgi:hypothetical protein